MKYTHSFIMLHAFTMKPSDMIYYKNYLQRILSKNVNINYIYPKAPVRKITCYDGQKYTAWFDYLSELVENEDDEINKDHLLEQVGKIHKIIDKEKKRYKGDCSKIELSVFVLILFISFGFCFCKLTISLFMVLIADLSW